ncbi:MAG: aldose 1-epimerase [Acidobacteria bacterium]|nr:aldose 1-epimerase [Acidobacteriota bacterium]
MQALANGAAYEARTASDDGIGIVQLRDNNSDTTVQILAGIGNIAYSMKVKGKDVFWSPYTKLSEFRAKPTLLGNPFLAPWANRLDQHAFFANGAKYVLNPELKNYRADGNSQPIHGLVTYTGNWKLVGIGADAKSAFVTSRLEFFRYPKLMAQFPFAHTIDMTYRLANGVLEVETEITNLGFEAMPLIIGYHPYFRLHDAPRDDWRVTLPAKQHVVLNEKLTPTGEFKPNPYADPLTLTTVQLDDVFTGLTRDSAGRAEFSVQGKSQKLSVLYGPKYTVAVVYAPKGRDFICFEPMTGITNSMNLAHEGKYKDLQSIAPGGVWKESFWIRTDGF